MITPLKELSREYFQTRNSKINYDFLATNHKLVQAIERWKEVLQTDGINSKKIVVDEITDFLDNNIFFIKKGATK
ncbi:MAG: hypothetical protein JEZ05_06310 [Tenericutes bacterium]|nr:hypothetical protein [Mycoplasmatota bacterium]